jgi:NAD(P)H dehydrogenase (quinone)
MSIVVTGATGQLGRLVLTELLDRGVPADRLVAVGRQVERLRDLAERGVTVRQADFDRPDTLAAAFDGAEQLLLVSGSEPGRRVAQHQNAIEAAAAVGVGLLAYTSILHGDRNLVPLAAEHIATEELLRASGLPVTLLRNGWYLENYTVQLADALDRGVIIGNAGDGRISAAGRADFAAAAAAVLTTDGHRGAVYELAGDQGFTMTELAAELTRQSGTQVAYRDLPQAEHVAALVGAGLPEPVAQLLAGIDAGISRGALFDDGGDLRRLAGRPTTPLADAIAATLAARTEAARP